LHNTTAKDMLNFTLMLYNKFSACET